MVVLGDVGRSPRMEYHALSLTEHGYIVSLVGYGDSKPYQDIIDNLFITLHFLKKETWSSAFPRILAYFVKVILQTSSLMSCLLFQVEASEYIMIQNPPCIPTMFVCWVVSIFNGSKLIIDWHNYGYTILGLTLGRNHKLVKLAHWYEKILGQLASRNLCVTRAMQEDLENFWHIHATVVYDRPPKIFKPLEVKEQHKLLMRLKDEYKAFNCRQGDQSSTAFTHVVSNTVERKKDRPVFMVSSTSWTEDEDFSILLNALKKYDESKAADNKNLPDLICAITGKGPMKDYYLKEIAGNKWSHVTIITPWLTAEDYPLLLGCSDLGISLHTSSSGLDLPMKVVDMFGCGVPVAAIEFDCIDELVKDGENGVIFRDASDLHKHLCVLLEDFSSSQGSLSNMRKNLIQFREDSWSKNWEEHVLPLL